MNQQIFVTQRKRGLYTEYTLQVSRMLKPLDKVATGSRLSVLRLGGLAKLPSGGTIEHEIRGYGPEPMVGSQYLFFLKYLPSPADAYTILKFWNVVRLEDGTKIVKAAFDQDLQRVQNKESNVDGKSLADVEAMIQISH